MLNQDLRRLCRRSRAPMQLCKSIPSCINRGKGKPRHSQKLCSDSTGGIVQFNALLLPSPALLYLWAENSCTTKPTLICGY